MRFKHALNKTTSVKRRDRTGTLYARAHAFCTPLKINSVNACLLKHHKCNMSSHGMENISVQLILLIHIPEGRQATNMSIKTRFKRIQDSPLRTLKSEHVIVRQRKEWLWTVGWQNGAALPPFPSTVTIQCDKFHNAVLMNWVEEKN